MHTTHTQVLQILIQTGFFAVRKESKGEIASLLHAMVLIALHPHSAISQKEALPFLSQLL